MSASTTGCVVESFKSNAANLCTLHGRTALNPRRSFRVLAIAGLCWSVPIGGFGRIVLSQSWMIILPSLTLSSVISLFVKVVSHVCCFISLWQFQQRHLSVDWATQFCCLANNLLPTTFYQFCQQFVLPILLVFTIFYYSCWQTTWPAQLHPFHSPSPAP